MRKEFESGYDFDRPDRTWACDNEEIDRVRALLDGTFSEPVLHVRVQQGTDAGGLIAALSDGRVDIASIADPVQGIVPDCVGMACRAPF